MKNLIIYAVSDSVGETAQQVAKACMSQFYRFEDEDDNPWIPYRQMSETPLPENHLLDARLRKEKEDAINQIKLDLHQAIVDAIIQSDGDAAFKACQALLRCSRHLVRFVGTAAIGTVQ